MPFSRNLFFGELMYGTSYKQYKTPCEIKKIFENINIDVNSKEMIACSCGSGCTACTLVFGLYLLGLDKPGQ